MGQVLVGAVFASVTLVSDTTSVGTAGANPHANHYVAIDFSENHAPAGDIPYANGDDVHVRVDMANAVITDNFPDPGEVVKPYALVDGAYGFCTFVSWDGAGEPDIVDLPLDILGGGSLDAQVNGPPVFFSSQSIPAQFLDGSTYTLGFVLGCKIYTVDDTFCTAFPTIFGNTATDTVQAGRPCTSGYDADTQQGFYLFPDGTPPAPLAWRGLLFEGVCSDDDNDGVCNDDEVFGCTDPAACNFDAAATEDNHRCDYQRVQPGQCFGGSCGARPQQIRDVVQIKSQKDGSDLLITPNVPDGYEYKDGYDENTPEYVLEGVPFWSLHDSAPELGFEECGRIQSGSAFGCTDDNADNFSPDAIYDDGSCFLRRREEA